MELGHERPHIYITETPAIRQAQNPLKHIRHIQAESYLYNETSHSGVVWKSLSQT